jgi:anionic cell wall polymer biosynthesis LytR-Cps2A-Psr (LCP) family protein
LVRVENQRIILQAIVKKILESDIVSMPGLITAMAANVGTTMEATTAVDLVNKFRGMPTENLYMATIPTYFNFHDETSFLGIVEPDFSEMMARFKQGLPPVDPAKLEAEALEQEEDY